MLQKAAIAVTLTAVILASSGCGANSEQKRVMNATVEAACLAKGVMDQLDPQKLAEKASKMTLEELGAFQEEMKQKQADIETQMNEILKKYEFESQAQFEEVAAKYDGDEKLKADAQKKAMEMCGADLKKFEELGSGL